MPRKTYPDGRKPLENRYAKRRLKRRLRKQAERGGGRPRPQPRPQPYVGGGAEPRSQDSPDIGRLMIPRGRGGHSFHE
jgi:hypothetical protein